MKYADIITESFLIVHRVSHFCPPFLALHSVDKFRDNLQRFFSSLLSLLGRGSELWSWYWFFYNNVILDVMVEYLVTPKLLTQR